VSSPRETQAEGELAGLDWLSAALASLGATFCCLLALYLGPRFQKIFADVGGELPALTQLAFMPWFPLVLGVIPALMIALALVAKTSLGIRRGLIVGAMVLSLSASGLCLYGIYGPIFAARELVRRRGISIAASESARATATP
jgi:hypothetical protein